MPSVSEDVHMFIDGKIVMNELLSTVEVIDALEDVKEYVEMWIEAFRDE